MREVVRTEVEEEREVAHLEFSIDADLRALIRIKGEEYVRQFVALRPLPF